jgi:hypothetical protein
MLAFHGEISPDEIPEVLCNRVHLNSLDFFGVKKNDYFSIFLLNLLDQWFSSFDDELRP